MDVSALLSTIQYAAKMARHMAMRVSWTVRASRRGATERVHVSALRSTNQFAAKTARHMAMSVCWTVRASRRGATECVHVSALRSTNQFAAKTARHMAMSVCWTVWASRRRAMEGVLSRALRYEFHDLLRFGADNIATEMPTKCFGTAVLLASMILCYLSSDNQPSQMVQLCQTALASSSRTESFS
jgi:hypothetical protein